VAARGAGEGRASGGGSGRRRWRKASSVGGFGACLRVCAGGGGLMVGLGRAGARGIRSIYFFLENILCRLLHRQAVGKGPTNILI